jgi:primosomal protein N' (replication factor Y)
MPNPQRSLFDTQPDPWELDDQPPVPVASVVFADGVEDAFDYRIPASLQGHVAAGKRLRVPLGRGNQSRTGYCVELRCVNATSRRLKDVQAVLDERPLLTPSLLRLTRWMAEYYLTAWGKVLEGIVPAGVRANAGTRLRRVYVIPSPIALPPSGKTLPTSAKLSTQQAAVFDVLRRAGRPLTLGELTEQAGCTAGPVRSLERKGRIVSRQERIESLRSGSEVVEVHQPIVLSSAQQASLRAVVDRLHRGGHETFLLHGVTGSGKTEVYIKAIEAMIGFGRQAIVLVPEISLTPQTQRRFRARFPAVAVLHSHLSDAERNWHWQRILRGEVAVIVGARSAVFAPAPRLGMIVIDEEHDASFKQDTLPRYHARDVALQRAREESIPLILGSATPSLESWVQAQSGSMRLLSMPHRVLDLPLPGVMTVDLRHEFQSRGQRGPISQRLHHAIQQALEQREQVILLLNRRGFSTHIQCQACGHVMKCPNCDLALTHHREGERAVCHYCDYTVSAPRCCPQCGFAGIRYGGLGTQRLEAEVRSRYPRTKILRMDSDTMRHPGSHDESLQRFRRGEVQILVGTQMIAKGLDFPNVTVVGVINADTALHLPDFRAAERTFQLVTQVAGRTGRGRQGGCVFVQTYHPDHPAIQAAERHDYLRFAAGELPLRQQFGYPPYGSMIRVIVRGVQAAQVADLASELAGRVEGALGTGSASRLLGPAPAPMEKLRGKYRYHLIVQGHQLGAVRQVLQQAQREWKHSDALQWQIDVDPQEML